MTKKFKGILKKIESNHNNLRTNEVEGVFSLPQVGEAFILFGKGLDFGTRLIFTTPVKNFNEKNMTFTTENSTYFLTIEEELPTTEKYSAAA